MARPKNTEGNSVEVQKGTFGKIIINRNSAYHKVYTKLRSDDKSVMDNILKFMQTDKNHIITSGDTMEAMVGDLEFNAKAIRNSLTRLGKVGLISKGIIKSEYFIEPQFAYKGDFEQTWSYLQQCNYRGQVPRSVIGWQGKSETQGEPQFRPVMYRQKTNLVNKYGIPTL